MAAAIDAASGHEKITALEMFRHFGDSRVRKTGQRGDLRRRQHFAAPMCQRAEDDDRIIGHAVEAQQTCLPLPPVSRDEIANDYHNQD